MMENNFRNISKGFKNLITGENKDISKERLKICQSCYKHYNNWCISKLGGCGCYLPAKTSHQDEKCPDKKW